MGHILIAYASKHGSTAEIAEAVAKELKSAGHTANAVEIGKVTSPDGYDAVIFGGPMYMGRIDSSIRSFVQRHATRLRTVPVAGFVVCLAAASNDTEGIAIAQKALHGALDLLHPVDETIFAGKLDPEKLSWFQRWITKRVKSPVGDFRDWSAIAAWAQSLPGKMRI